MARTYHETWVLRGATLLLSAFSLLTLGGIARAEGVRIVESPELGSFWQIQGAVDAAVDGDVLLVGTGRYGSFVVDGKSLWIVAPAGQDVRIDGTVEVRNLPVGGNVVITNVFVVGNIPPSQTCWPPCPNTSDPGLRVTGNVGHVRFQDCTFFGGNGTGGNQPCGAENHGGPGVVLDSNQSVVFAGCILGGGWGEDGQFCTSCCGGDGGNALQSIDSAVALYDCRLVGGKGGDFGLTGGKGGHACDITGFGVFASGCTFIGGGGGTAQGGPVMQGGDGGDGLFAHDVVAQLLDNSFTGGLGGVGMGVPNGNPGLPILEVAAVVNHYPGSARSLTGPTVASDDQPMSITVTGEAGDRVYLLFSRNTSFGFVKTLASVWLVPGPFFLPSVPNGTIPASGVLNLQLNPPQVTSPRIGIRSFAQALILKAGEGGAVLSGPIHPVILGRFGQPDCNANSVNDYLDTIEGTSADLNGNLIPDECDYKGPIWYVAAGGPQNGDGSQGLPFTDLRPAMDVAKTGHEIVLADGTYTGPDNREQVFAGRDLIVRSQNGPANCIIDCENLGRAFLFEQGETPAAVLRGLTITRGSSDWGGGVRITNASPTIDDCVITNCTATLKGGGISVAGGSPTFVDCKFSNCFGQRRGGGLSITTGTITIEGCEFVGNMAPGRGYYPYYCFDGGGGVSAYNATVTIEYSLFENNKASANVAPYSVGGGLYVEDPTGPTLISHSIFRSNSGRGGGLVYDTFPSGTIDLVNCLIEDNFSSVGGGGVSIRATAGVISGCTIVHNRAGRDGGGISTSGISIQNSILWGNFASGSGQQLAYAGTTAVNYCDIEGGQAGIYAKSTPSELLYGAGNLEVDPLFVGLMDYHLGPTSPCIDAGDNTAVPSDVLDLDGDGNVTEPIPFDLDRLARFIDVPSVPDTGNGIAPIVDMGGYERQGP